MSTWLVTECSTTLTNSWLFKAENRRRHALSQKELRRGPRQDKVVKRRVSREREEALIIFALVYSSRLKKLTSCQGQASWCLIMLQMSLRCLGLLKSDGRRNLCLCKYIWTKIKEKVSACSIHVMDQEILYSFLLPECTNLVQIVEPWKRWGSKLTKAVFWQRNQPFRLLSLRFHGWTTPLSWDFLVVRPKQTDTRQNRIRRGQPWQKVEHHISLHVIHNQALHLEHELCQKEWQRQRKETSWNQGLSILYLMNRKVGRRLSGEKGAPWKFLEPSNKCFLNWTTQVWDRSQEVFRFLIIFILSFWTLSMTVYGTLGMEPRRKCWNAFSSRERWKTSALAKNRIFPERQADPPTWIDPLEAFSNT